MKSIYEYAKGYRKNQNLEPADDKVIDNGKLVDPEKKDPERMKGKDAGNRSWGYEEPTDDDIQVSIPREDMDRNTKRLMMKFKAEEPFFILGKAGWGKTSIIKQLAKKNRRAIITVYLDKAMATDLDGIPVPVQNDDGTVSQKVAIPAWADVMLKNPDKKFLLFFDEMNQAAPDVQNALMPIVLETTISGIKFDNFMVGAAGNFSSENEAVSELSGPLKSRFKPIIVWETNNDTSWKSAFKYLHKKWDSQLGRDFIDMYERDATLFANPRELDTKVFGFLKKLIDNTDADERSMYEPEDFLERLTDLKDEESDQSRHINDKLARLAENTYEFFIAGGSLEQKMNSKPKGFSREANMLPIDVTDLLKDILSKGFYIDDDGSRVKITRKDMLDPKVINDTVDLEDLGITLEQFTNFIKNLPARDVKFEE